MSEELSQKEIEGLKAQFRDILFKDLDVTLAALSGSGKLTLNLDDLFKMLPRYDEHPQQRYFLGPMLYSVAREFIDAAYEALLLRPFGGDDTIVFTAGGSATGKSTILRTAGIKEGVDFIVDTTFSDSNRALAQVDRALATGRKVEINYVHRNFRNSVIGMVKRARDLNSGRLVPIDDMARTHFGAQRAVLDALQAYEMNPGVSIRLWANVERKELVEPTEEEFEESLHRSVDDLRKMGQNILDELLHNKSRKRPGKGSNHHARGQSVLLPQALYEAARSKVEARGTLSG